VELLDQPAGELVVHLQQLPPAPIPEPGGTPGGGDDVGEQHGRQHPAGLGGAPDPGEELVDGVKGQVRGFPEEVHVRPRELDQRRPERWSAR
jgi:hypothetical protein